MFCRASYNLDYYVEMRQYVRDLETCDEITHVFIDAFLIDHKQGGVYELLYYGISAEVDDIAHSHFIEFPKRNCLPKEILENIKPQLIVARGDEALLIDYLYHYLECMDKMEFKQDRDSSEDLKDAELYYQILWRTW